MSFNARNRTLLGAFASVSVALGVGTVGIAMATSGRPAAAASHVAIGVKHNQSLGRILYAGPKHLTVYAFARDHRGHSSCTGACTKGWPPVTTNGKPRAVAGANAADLGTITRSNGSKQATYDGHPVYFFAGDQTGSTASGQRVSAFGGRWYVIGANGKEITKAPTTNTTTGTTTTNTYTYPSTTTGTTPTNTYTYPPGY